MDKNFYDFSALSIQGKEIRMDEYRGKFVLVVNTASKCGFTPQYKGLEELYQKYRSRNLVVLGFPCNQFAHQEPGDEQSISQGCLLNYGVSFPMFAKIEVNGKNAHPLYVYLKSELSGILGSKIKWNFTKFFISDQGNPVKRFAPATKPEKIGEWIEKNHIFG